MALRSTLTFTLLVTKRSFYIHRYINKTKWIVNRYKNQALYLLRGPDTFSTKELALVT